MKRIILTASVALLASTGIAAAEFQISVYGGVQTAPHSGVTVTGPTAPQQFTAGWEGRSLQTPPYYGVRGTWWMDFAPAWGLSLDFTHAKVYADAPTLGASGWNHFEFSDGINTLTLNGMYRYQKWDRFEPYAGLGVGVSIPHVEVFRPSGNTFGYQVGGAAFEALAGASYKLTDHLSVFGEYQFNYTMNNVSIDSGDSLQTNVILNAFALGVSVNF